MFTLESVRRHPIVEAAGELRPVLAKHRDEADEQARIAPRVLQAMGEAGMFRLCAPREIGGLELPLGVTAAVLEELAAGDAGAAWHALNAAMAGFVSAHLDAASREELFADPAAHIGLSLVPGGRAVPCDGGFELSGYWPFVTGSRDATWALLMGVVKDGRADQSGPPDVRTFIVKMDDLAVEDTWNAAASMRSTGSHAARASGVLVESRFTFAPDQPLLIDRPLYRLPRLIAYTATAPPVMLGVLRSAFEAAVASASGKRSRLDGSAYRDMVTVRQAVANAAAVHHCCLAGLLSAYFDAESSTERHGSLPPTQWAVMGATMVHTADQARETVSRLAAAATSDLFTSGHGTERAIRDVHALHVPFEIFRSAQQAAGGVLLGAEANHPAY